MKKITLWVIVLLTSVQLHAQLTNGNFTTEVDERLKNLSKTSITSNILIDRVFPAAGIQAFNQETRKDTSNVSHFKQAWSELYRASYTKNFASIETFKQQLKDKNYATNIVPIGIINTEFHQCNFGTTVQNATVDFNPTTGLFANKPNKNPFVKKQTTIIAPLVAKATGSTIAFKTDNLFTLYKQGKPIKTLQLYTNNTSFTLVSNYNLIAANFTTTYPTTAVQILRFVITYSDNTTKTTYGKLKIVKPITYAQRGAVSALKIIEADNDLLFQGYDENQTYRGKNEYRIYYNDDNEIIDKPVYIIDGYDPNDTRKIEKNDTGHTSDKSIRELMSYDIDNNPDTNNNVDLVEDLNAKGYDVIIVNHPVNPDNGIDGGSDYIERNAYTFISLLRHIKSIQQGTEKAVVIGPSMGGLITRYALAYMEKKLAETGDDAKWNHNTRLWVSFDAPHQGANIPIGLQHNIDFFANNMELELAKKFINEQLDQPAPKQMLVHYYKGNPYPVYPKGATGFRDRFQQKLNALGMPKNLRKIALLNGSISGDTNGVPGGLITDNNIEFDGIAFPLFFIPSSLFADKLEFIIRNTPKQNTSQVFRGGVKGKFLWWEYYVSLDKKSVKDGGAYDNHSSYDTGSGSYTNAQSQLNDAVEGADIETTFEPVFISTLILWLDRKNLNIIEPTHTFIPTKSALAYTGNKVLDENLSHTNLVCNNKIPFDSYFAPQNNEKHIHLTPENVNWLTEEIMGNPQEPHPVIVSEKAIDIKGNDLVCFSGYNTYIRKTPSPCESETQWAVSGGLMIISETPSSITVRAITSSISGTGWVALKDENGIIRGIKHVWIGKPLKQHLVLDHVGGNYTIGANKWSQLQAHYLINYNKHQIKRFKWNLPNSRIRYNGYNNQSVLVSPLKVGYYGYSVQAENNCGCSDKLVKGFNVILNGSNMVISPE